MDADEKLAALKKAYADIILSISKEAAARVMASEKKSLMHQHELKMAKCEGLRMMLRLKQMMDSQIIQSQAASLNQQKKIDELEAQLQEAEDIVSDLRDELRQAQAELERAKSMNPYLLNGSVLTYPNENPIMSNLYPYQSVDCVPPNASSHVSAPFANFGSQDLPSIILRGKGPSLYRINGCIQRIRACDRNLLDKDLSLSEEIPKVEGEIEKESKELESNKKSADVELSGCNSIPVKGKRAARRRKTIIPLAGEKSVFSEDCAHSDSVKLSLDKDLTQSQKVCDDERDVTEFIVEKEMLKDNNGMNEEADNVVRADGPSCILEVNSLEGKEGISSRPVRERDFKYTFQRKRKRSAPSESDANGSPEKGKMTLEKNCQ